MIKDSIGLVMAVTMSGPLAQCEQLAYEHQTALDVLTVVWLVPLLSLGAFVVWSPLLILLQVVFGRK